MNAQQGVRHIHVYTSRPVRDTVIDKEDIIDLRIALELTKTVEEFIDVLDGRKRLYVGY